MTTPDLATLLFQADRLLALLVTGKAGTDRRAAGGTVTTSEEDREREIESARFDQRCYEEEREHRDSLAVGAWRGVLLNTGAVTLLYLLGGHPVGGHPDGLSDYMGMVGGVTLFVMIVWAGLTFQLLNKGSRARRQNHERIFGKAPPGLSRKARQSPTEPPGSTQRGQHEAK